MARERVEILPRFDRFEGLRGFVNNLVAGQLERSRNQQFAQQLGTLFGDPNKFASLTDPRAATIGAQLGMQERAPKPRITETQLRAQQIQKILAKEPEARHPLEVKALNAFYDVPATKDDTKFYTNRGYSAEEAQLILDARFGLEKKVIGRRSSKDISMDLSRWQTIYTKTREVGILGQFGDIFDPETAKLAEENIVRLRNEISGQPKDVGKVTGKPSERLPLTEEIKPPGISKKRPLAPGMVRMQRPPLRKGLDAIIFHVPERDIGKKQKQGWKITDDSLVKDKRGWIKFIAPDGTLTWVNPKDIETAISKKYKLSK